MMNPINTNRQIRVIIVGAGASGLLMAYKLQRNFDDVEFQIYEKNPDIGGTWYENRYPGCACDNRSPTYVWSFGPNPNWSSIYGSSSEVFEYFKGFQSRLKLNEKTKVSHQVIGAKWDSEVGKWNADIKDIPNNTVVHDACLKYPTIPGLHDFEGQLVHSSPWDTNIDLKEKHVGLIGNGSPEIQILPAILPEVASCTTFVRWPTWVAVSGLFGFQPRRFEPDEKDRFTKDPNALLTFRCWLEHNMNNIYPLFFAKSEAQDDAHNLFVDSMKDALNIPGLAEKVISSWAVGCRRLTPGVGYLQSLNHPKATVVHGGINRITGRGCQMEDRKEYPVYVLICAKDEPRSYLGITDPGYPNYNIFLGPNSPIGNGPVLVGIEAQADYICRHITRIQQQGVRSIEVTKEAVNDFIEHKDQYMKDMVWNQDCRSWYKGNTADWKIIALWPGSTLHYIDTLQQVRYGDYKVQYFGNRFSYLGNGPKLVPI
ncbi:hypothetical protein BDV27DRAFT_146125 [Aspergillus caelatus]|uniref:Monooxygenase n=1 Tax=Aspergillus caelatus TaxID=61420 RepID=A0A5N7A0K7_9EURO|nr:uncharacterized protein BDV27DRAFT_146125 [Aspergillus caelatus]KAE8363404.1 hypothetical protein BDV27DRAFT_146125 [Aspergillus caelatus]